VCTPSSSAPVVNHTQYGALAIKFSVVKMGPLTQLHRIDGEQVPSNKLMLNQVNYYCSPFLSKTKKISLISSCCKSSCCGGNQRRQPFKIRRRGHGLGLNNMKTHQTLQCCIPTLLGTLAQRGAFPMLQARIPSLRTPPTSLSSFISTWVACSPALIPRKGKERTAHLKPTRTEERKKRWSRTC